MTQAPEVNRQVTHDVDFCVVGGGMAGLIAALAAARHGARVALMHDRPVLGGNASSECRMHISGADRSGQIPDMRETGLLEEIRLEDLTRNPLFNYSIWDLVLYEKARFQPNLTLLLNCSCLDAETDGARITSVTGWQLTTYTRHTVRAKIFADCSGDGVLAPLTGAAFRVGREGRDEYGESIAPETADDRTMGMTCLFQARWHEEPKPFEAPPWARRFETEDELPYGGRQLDWLRMGYWWIELGGEHDSIHDTETLRDELLKVTLGVWDFIKNRSRFRRLAENWAIEWLQFLPAKRESRRYVGARTLTQNDIEAEGRFDDIVAYGGWSMDDHHPAGFDAVKLDAPATIFHPAPSPYGIPYGCLYARDVENLMFAGRCMSCSHAAMSSTRVMGTLSAVGQSVGVAAAIAVREGLDPAGVASRIPELQQTLLRDDCYLPWTPLEFGPLTANAELRASQGDPEPLRDGVNRPVGDELHAWVCRPGDHAEYVFDAPRDVEQATLVLDSSLDKNITMSLHYTGMLHSTPETLPRPFRIEGLVGDRWETVERVEGNTQRLVRVPLRRRLGGVRFVLEATWGAAESRTFAFWVD